MTTGELKRASQLRTVVGSASRTEGERVAARNLIAKIESKAAARNTTKRLFTIDPIYARMVDVAY